VILACGAGEATSIANPDNSCACDTSFVAKAQRDGYPLLIEPGA
jgi:hypothetical protein